jgi:hypothetical protein
LKAIRPEITIGLLLIVLGVIGYVVGLELRDPARHQYLYPFGQVAVIVAPITVVLGVIIFLWAFFSTYKFKMPSIKLPSPSSQEPVQEPAKQPQYYSRNVPNNPVTEANYPEEDIQRILSEGEQILLIAKQSRYAPGGSMITPSSIYVTNLRVIWRNPTMFGLKKNYTDVDFSDISNIRMNSGVFSTEIYLKTRNLSDEIVLPAIDKQDAEQVNIIIRKIIRGESSKQQSNREFTHTITKEKEIIIKIRCRYCGNTYEETLDKCPQCGGRS